MRKLDGALRTAAPAFVLLASFAVGCKGPMAKIERLRDALVSDDATPVREATAGFPTCAEEPPVSVAP